MSTIPTPDQPSVNPIIDPVREFKLSTDREHQAQSLVDKTNEIIREETARQYRIEQEWIRANCPGCGHAYNVHLCNLHGAIKHLEVIAAEQMLAGHEACQFKLSQPKDLRLDLRLLTDSLRYLTNLFDDLPPQLRKGIPSKSLAWLAELRKLLGHSELAELESHFSQLEGP